MSTKNNILEIKIIAWYNIMHEQIENICYFLSKIILKGDDYGIQSAMKNHANSSIIIIKLSASYLNLSIQPINNQPLILPANANFLFLKLLLLFFSLALAVKMPEWISNQGYSLIMRGVAVYGQTQRRCIAAPLPRRALKFPGPYFKTSWVMP